MLTSDINSVIQGAIREGVTEVVISEGHANMRNVLLEELHPAARVVRGPAAWVQKPLCQVAGLDDSFDLGFFVGFHSRAGTHNGLLSHTWAGAVVHRLLINGLEAGETLIDAALLGEQGVPVALVCGADDVAREAKADLGEVETAIVKEALGPQLAACWGPRRTAGLLADAASRAVQRHRLGAFNPLRLSSPTRVDIEVKDDAMAARMVQNTPGMVREGRRHLIVQADTVTGALSMAWRGISEVFHKPDAWLK